MKCTATISAFSFANDKSVIFFFSWLFLIFFNQLQYYIILYLSNSPTCVSVEKYVDMH